MGTGRDRAAAYVARARARSEFHRFDAALQDLAVAQRYGADEATVADERAAVLESIGRYDGALELRQQAWQNDPSFASAAGLASAYASSGLIAEAVRLFADSHKRYRGVSPFPLAMLELRRGHMWLAEGRLTEARGCFVAALTRVPAYAPAAMHLAEIDAANGDLEAAIDGILPVAETSDHPEYADYLGRWLAQARRPHDARRWLQLAATRYDELATRFPEAFADHAADFWLWNDTDPHKALKLAAVNLATRQTPSARALWARADEAVGRLSR